jgi:hypothetical protein
MHLDKNLMISDSQALTGTSYSQNSIDLGNVTPKNEIGAGEPMALVVNVEVAADHTTGDETYQIDVIQSANENLSSGTPLAGAVISYSLLTAGAVIVIPIPPGSVTARYLGAIFTLGGTLPSMTVSAFVTPLQMTGKNKVYASGYAVS